ncbi:MAG: hypothetical protein EHM23_31360, partial [Acidobacteria bacterium]
RDGQSIYFRSNSSGSSEIWKMPGTGGEAVRITRNTGDLPEESPDGEFLYYMKGEGYPKQCSLWRMPTGGGEETRVVDSTSCQGPYAVWKEGIYFLTRSDQQEHRNLNLYDFSTGKTRKIPSVELPDAMFIAVSPDGQTILYTHYDQAGSDLMLVENFH